MQTQPAQKKEAKCVGTSEVRHEQLFTREGWQYLFTAQNRIYLFLVKLLGVLLMQVLTSDLINSAAERYLSSLRTALDAFDLKPLDGL